MAFLFGLQSARTKTQILQDILQEQKQNCPNFSCQQIIGEVSIEAGKGSKVSGVRFKQECQISGECLFNGSIKSLAQSIQKAHANAKGGLGWTFAEANEEATSIVKQIQEQNCGGITNEQIIKTVNIKSGDDSKITDVSFDQIADLKLRCLYESIADNIVKNEQIAEASATGLDPTAIIGIIVLIVIIIAGGGLLLGGKVIDNVIPSAAKKGIGALLGIGFIGVIGFVGYRIYQNKTQDKD